MGGRRIAVAVAAGVAATWLVLADLVRPAHAPSIVLGLAAGWSFIVSGLVAWHRRPGNRIGPVMVATGFARFATELMWSRQPVLATVGHVLDSFYFAGVAYVLGSFPTGRLGSSLPRRLASQTIPSGSTRFCVCR